MQNKLEHNVRYLLINCEDLLKQEKNYWQVKKYIKALETMIDEIRESKEFSSEQELNSYVFRLDQLKNIIRYEPSPKSTKKTGRKPDRSLADSSTREIQQMNTTRVFNNLRNELIEDNNVRQRREAPSENMGQAIQYYGNVQEKIAENMLLLTNSLKEQTETANKIIKRDTEIVNKSSDITNKNINSLSNETDRLRDHSKKAWKCWMWVMVALVMLVFISMVLLMKVAKKKA